MPKYNVFIFPTIQVKVVDIEAENQAGAVQKATEHLYDVGGNDLRYVLGYLPPSPLKWIESVEFAEEIDGFLVDEIGDTDFKKSLWYEGDGKTVAGVK